MTYKFTCLADETKNIVFDNFKDAFIAMFNYVNELISSNSLTWQELETAIWIEEERMPIYFYDARDRACDENILDSDGNIT